MVVFVAFTVLRNSTSNATPRARKWGNQASDSQLSWACLSKTLLNGMRCILATCYSFNMHILACDVNVSLVGTMSLLRSVNWKRTVRCRKKVGSTKSNESYTAAATRPINNINGSLSYKRSTNNPFHQPTAKCCAVVRCLYTSTLSPSAGS